MGFSARRTRQMLAQRRAERKFYRETSQKPRAIKLINLIFPSTFSFRFVFARCVCATAAHSAWGFLTAAARSALYRQSKNGVRNVLTHYVKTRSATLRASATLRLLPPLRPPLRSDPCPCAPCADSPPPAGLNPLFSDPAGLIQRMVRPCGSDQRSV